MATFKPEVQNKRVDGTYNVRIRITHNREVRRLSTNLYVTDRDLTRSLKIKNQSILDQTADIIQQCRKICNKLGYSINQLSVEDLVKEIKLRLDTIDNQFQLNFIEYTRQKAAEKKKSTGDSYLIALNCLLRFIKRDELDIFEITTDFLRKYEKFIENEPSQQGNNRKHAQPTIVPKKGRAVSAYIACIRAVYNLAKKEFNEEDRGIIRIPYSPFKNYDIKSQPKTRKRAITPELIQSIINLPYEEETAGRNWSRFNLAKDCFILSFALIGINAIDLYDAPIAKQNVLIYNRTKTEDRRKDLDNAEMRVLLEDCISPLIEKYKDPTGKRMFKFYTHYVNHEGFNAALNKGLKQIGEIVGIEDLEFYAARHSWATIARSAAVGIDKATVHEALNHVDTAMKVTDIYIDKDWSVIWNANKKVLSLFDWSELELLHLL